MRAFRASAPLEQAGNFLRARVELRRNEQAAQHADKEAQRAGGLHGGDEIFERHELLS